MVNSIIFNDVDGGYLNKKEHNLVLKEGFTKADYDKAMEDEWKFKKEHHCRTVKDYFYEEVVGDYVNDRARKCLLNRKFEFSKDKINLIFGPNASGKSTILKTIAAYSMCGGARNFDGFTSAFGYEPLDYPHSFLSRDKTNGYTQECLIDLIEKKSGNKAIVEWDGNPVYYHAFEKIRPMMDLNDFEDNILGGMFENLGFMMNGGSLSDGKKSLYIFSKLFNIAKSKVTTQDVIDAALKRSKEVNDSWRDCYVNNARYLQDRYDGTNTIKTILLDEIDKSLDLNNVAYIFSELLPQLREINNDQIIVISHSPLVLSETICNPEKYNLISMDEDYTIKVKNMLKTLKF